MFIVKERCNKRKNLFGKTTLFEIFLSKSYDILKSTLYYLKHENPIFCTIFFNFNDTKRFSQFLLKWDKKNAIKKKFPLFRCVNVFGFMCKFFRFTSIKDESDVLWWKWVALHNKYLRNKLTNKNFELQTHWMKFTKTFEPHPCRTFCYPSQTYRRKHTPSSLFFY